MLKDSDPRLYERRKTGLAAISLREDDLLIEVKVTDKCTGYSSCYKIWTVYPVQRKKDVRSTGRVSMGVRGMNLSDNDEIIGMQMSSQGKDMLIVSEKVWENVQVWKNSQNKIAAEKA